MTAQELRALLGDRRVSTAETVLEQHGSDESYHAPHPPDAVVFPESTGEVAAVVRACRASRTPVIAYGTGTSLEGHVAAIRGGVCVDLSRLNAILEINPDDLDCTVQAGVTRRQLDERLRREGLFFPVDPGADASLGGMAATRASGTTTVRYGTMRDNVIRMEVVLADGSVIRTGSRARKSSAGYDLTRLFVGSEGTLGIITALTLKLQGVPEAIASAVCSFPAVDAAVATVVQIVQLGIPVARAELLDDVQMDAVNRHSGLAYAALPTVFFEFHGSSAGVAEQAAHAGDIAIANGGSAFEWSTDSGERNRLWHARHNAYYASLALRPGSKGFPTDVCVPISRLAQCIAETRADIEHSGLLAPIVGHVGDGNFHVLFVLDPSDASELERAKSVNDRMVARALGMDGTCTGEHGVGYGKMDFVAAEHGAALEAMRAVKRALDPDDLMNPGKSSTEE